jgi:hypothetical protein
MLKRPEIVISIFLLLLISNVNSQYTSHSPYSKFGIGDVSQKGFAQNRAMGGLGVSLRSKNQINYQNPASYSSQDTMSFILDVGILGNYTVLETEEFKDATRDINLDHVAISFPLTKYLKSGLGVIPFSKVNYDLILDDNSEENTDDYSIAYTGTGGINQFFLGNSLLIGKHIALGVNFSYLFGTIERTKTVTLTNYAYHAYTYFNDKANVGGFYLNYGLQLFTDINEKHKLTFGLTYTGKTEISAKYDSMALRDFTPFRIDTIKNNIYKDGKITLPRETGIGLSYNFSNKLLIGLDFISENWEKAVFPGQGDTMANSSSFRFGIEYMPVPSTTQRKSKYWERIKFRAGGHYTKTYLVINDNQLADYGLSFGIGLPWRNDKKLFTNTYFNFAYELGTRGSIDNMLIKERYHLFTIGLTLYDFWFFKPKYD